MSRVLLAFLALVVVVAIMENTVEACTGILGSVSLEFYNKILKAHD